MSLQGKLVIALKFKQDGDSVTSVGNNLMSNCSDLV